MDITDESFDLLGEYPEPHRSNIETALLRDWNKLAAFAYSGYLARGRGLTAATLKGDLIDSVIFLPRAVIEKKWQTLATYSDPLTSERVDLYTKEYNPEEEIALMVQFGLDDCLVTRVFYAALLLIQEKKDSVVPRLKRWTLKSPIVAYREQFQRVPPTVDREFQQTKDLLIQENQRKKRKRWDQL